MLVRANTLLLVAFVLGCIATIGAAIIQDIDAFFWGLILTIAVSVAIVVREI